LSRASRCEGIARLSALTISGGTRGGTRARSGSETGRGVQMHCASQRATSSCEKKHNADVTTAAGEARAALDSAGKMKRRNITRGRQSLARRRRRRRRLTPRMIRRAPSRRRMPHEPAGRNICFFAPCFFFQDSFPRIAHHRGARRGGGRRGGRGGARSDTTGGRGRRRGGGGRRRGRGGGGAT
jgi:hypothetical protein